MSHCLIVASSVSTIHTISNIVTVIFVVIVVGILGFAAFMFLGQKGKKKDNGFDKKKEKKGDIVNSRLFLKDVEDIRDGIVITDQGTRFIAAIKCGGYSFFSDTSFGQFHTMNEYQRFFKAVSGPITYRSSSRVIDAEKPIKKYQQKIDELTKLYQDIIADIESRSDKDPAKEELIAKAESVGGVIDHLSAQLAAIRFYSSSENISDTYQCYVFEWQYKSAEYQMEMSPDEIFLLAKSELGNMASSYISVLADAHVHAKLLSQTEMLELFRQQSKPASSEQFPLKDYENSSFSEDIITSDSLAKKYVEAEEELKSGAPDVKVEKLFSGGGDDNA